MRYLTVDEPSRVRLPFSEACMHMRLAGKERSVIPLPDGMAQIVNDDGTPYSFPITWGEAGILQDGNGHPYVT